MASSSGCARGQDGLSSPGAEEKTESAWQSDAPDSDRRFPRSWRLTARRQFRQVYDRGRRVGFPSFTLFGVANDVGHCRLGITVTRRFGSAAARNRAKRVLRDIFRRNKYLLAGPLDIVVNAHVPMLARPMSEIERDLVAGIRRIARGGGSPPRASARS